MDSLLNELILTISGFLGDRPLIMFMSVSNRYRTLLINDIIWKKRLENRFKIQTSDILVFQQYIKYHIRYIFMKTFTLEITPDMIYNMLKTFVHPITYDDTLNIVNQQFRTMMQSLFNCVDDIRLIKYDSSSPVVLNTQALKSIKGKTQDKIYNIAGGIIIGMYYHGQCFHGHNNGYIIKGKRCYTLRYGEVFDNIVDLLNQDYHIAKPNINEKTYKKLVKLGIVSVSTSKCSRT